MKKLLFISFFLPFALFAQQNQTPVVSNITGNLALAAKKINLQFDLSDVENDPMTVSVYASDTLDKNVTLLTSVTGDIGKNILSGKGKSIEIDLKNVTLASKFKILIVADDEKVPTITDILSQVNCDRMMSDLAFLASKPRHRTSNAAHLQAVRDSIQALLNQTFGNANVSSFTAGTYTGKNFAASKIGKINPKKSYLIDAHYDTVSNAPGADDNGSGTVAMMEAARILSKYQFKKTIQVAAFDMEEDGLLGSRAFAKSLTNNEIAGVFNFEMIGFYSEMKNAQTLPAGFNQLFPQAYNAVKQDTFKGNFITNVGNVASNDLIATFNTAAALYVPNLKVISVAVPGTGTVAPDLRRSDHASFWDKNIQALMLTDGANFRNKNYHEDSDTLSTINKTFMCNVLKATLASAITLAELDHSGSQSKTFDTSVSTKNIIENCQFKITPNPAKTTLHLQFGNCEALNGTIEILDLNGRVLLQQKLEKDATILNLDIRPLAKGVYFAKVNSTSQRFVVQY